jgi:hypothetical protein
MFSKTINIFFFILFGFSASFEVQDDFLYCQDLNETVDIFSNCHEKFNDLIKNDYYRSTNRHDIKCLEQLLDKKQRQEYSLLDIQLKD